MQAIDSAPDAGASARLSYYGLRAQPFQPTADPEYMWLGERQREVLAAMRAGVLENAGLVLLTGDVGTGKTTLAHALEESLGDDVSVARLDYPGLAPLDFFKIVATAYGLGDVIVSRETFLQGLVSFLTRAHAIGRRVLLVLDEAQSLSGELLEEIGHLARLEHENVRLLNILLVGQDELGAIVLGPQHRELRAHIAARHSIEPLTTAEVDEYVRHRLTVAGGAHSPFGADAVREIAALSRGIPRLINLIADLALLRGFQAKAVTITPEIIAECARELSPQDLGGRRERRRRYAVPSAGTRRTTLLARHRRAVASVVLLGVLAVIGGYFYAHGRVGARGGGPEPVAPRGATKPGPPSETIGRRPGAAPTRAIESESPAAVRQEREVAAPASPPAVATPSRPPIKEGAGEAAKPGGASRVAPAEPTLSAPRPRPTSPAREGAPAERAASDSAAKSPPRPRAAPPAEDATSREQADTPDPGAIIDWLLKESPARRE
jgi:type II secretory pathway predicted ATPase ExeA